MTLSLFGLDITEKIALVKRPPTEEVVTEEDLVELFKTNSRPKHYIGLEISGFLHLGSLISTGFKVNDFIEAGIDCTIFLADWHTMINDKLSGDIEKISKVSKYYESAFRAVCPKATIRNGTELYNEHPEYWTELVRFTKHMSLARTMRALTIMGRSENEEKIDLGKLLYPAMQAVDIHFLDVDIAHAGMDQRKIHMLVRENFPKMNWKVPVAVHHKLLPGLTQPPEGSDTGAKMSKSNPNSGIFIHDSADEIHSKIKKAWCEEANITNNPLLEISKQIIFHENNSMDVERPEKFGGNVSFENYDALEKAFANKELHPSDLKQTVGKYLAPIVTDVASKVELNDEVKEIIKNSV